MARCATSGFSVISLTSPSGFSLSKPQPICFATSSSAYIKPTSSYPLITQTGLFCDLVFQIVSASANSGTACVPSFNRIEASPFQASGRVTLNSLESETANATVPPTLMAYLPMLPDNATVLVQTNSFGKKICIEIFEGVIQPWETTEWWRRHELAIRSPNSTINGQVNPSVKLNATQSGLYTLVIVPRERDYEATKVDLQVSMGWGNLRDQK